VFRRNLKLVFPEMLEKELEGFYKKNSKIISRIIVDYIKIPRISKTKLEKMFVTDYDDEFKKYLLTKEKPAALFLSGHIGSFELLLYFFSNFIYPTSFVAREFKNDKFDIFWNKRRTLNNNKLIKRSGAYKKILKALDSNELVSILFDQNLVRTNAFFPKWFGKKAATTKSVSAAILAKNPKIFMGGLFYVGYRQYKCQMRNIDFTDLINNKNITKDEKMKLITQELVYEFEKYIVRYKYQWFWMHKRWKTTENEKIVEDFYL